MCSCGKRGVREGGKGELVERKTVEAKIQVESKIRGKQVNRNEYESMYEYGKEYEGGKIESKQKKRECKGYIKSGAVK